MKYNPADTYFYDRITSFYSYKVLIVHSRHMQSFIKKLSHFHQQFSVQSIYYYYHTCVIIIYLILIFSAIIIHPFLPRLIIYTYDKSDENIIFQVKQL